MRAKAPAYCRSFARSACDDVSGLVVMMKAPRTAAAAAVAVRHSYHVLIIAALGAVEV